MSRLWIFAHYAVPPDAGANTRHFDLARELVSRGHEVTIFAAGFSHVSRREERLRTWQLVRAEQIEGVRFVWIRTTPYSDNAAGRALNMLSYLFMAPVAQVGRRTPDVVIGSSVHPFAALAGYFVSRARGARFFFEVRDLWPQTLVDLGAMRERSPVVKALRRLEEFLYRRAERVITPLEGAAAYIVPRGARPEQVVYIPNGVVLSRNGASSAQDEWETTGPTRAESAAANGRDWRERFAPWRARHRFVAAYAGLFGVANGLEVLVEAAALLRDRGRSDIGIVLVGDGPERPQLEGLVEQRKLDGVLLLDLIPKAEIPELLSGVDAGVLHLHASPVYRYGLSPNKLFDYLAAARPVVFAVGTQHDPVRASGAGISVPPDDAAALADALERLAALPEHERARMGANGLQYVKEHHDVARIAGRLAELIER